MSWYKRFVFVINQRSAFFGVLELFIGGACVGRRRNMALAADEDALIRAVLAHRLVRAKALEDIGGNGAGGDSGARGQAPSNAVGALVAANFRDEAFVKVRIGDGPSTRRALRTRLCTRRRWRMCLPLRCAFGCGS